MIYIVRTTVGRENAVIETIASKAKNLNIGIKAIFHPAEIRGYVFIEASMEQIQEVVRGVPHVRGIIKKEVPYEEVKKFLEFKKAEIKVSRGDIIEVMGGPFKNEKGKVVRVDEAKEEVTVELLEAAIPIPITVSLDSIRVIESQSEEKGEE